MEFVAWTKTPRLLRDITVSEKIDGTNACIIFEQVNAGSEVLDPNLYPTVTDSVGGIYYAGAQSRNRLIYPAAWSGDKQSDNHGFAAWVYENVDDLFELLGPGRHYGEWWGKGIARNYGADVKVFSLFNTAKHKGLDDRLGENYINTVPVLYEGPFSIRSIQECLYDLQALGSHAWPGFRKAEGVVVYHHSSKQVFKVTLDNEDKGKWEVAE